MIDVTDMNPTGKYIFLDFDGVICTPNNPRGFDKVACERVQEIVNRTGAKIVITSSRKRNTVVETVQYCAELWEESGYDLKDLPRWMNEDICGVTERGYRVINENDRFHHPIPRGVEIQWWVDKHAVRFNYDIGDWYPFKYVILDDDTDMLLWQKDCFIQTDPISGITEDDVARAISILS